MDHARRWATKKVASQHLAKTDICKYLLRLGERLKEEGIKTTTKENLRVAKEIGTKGEKKQKE